MKDPELILKDNPGSVVFAPYAEVLAQSGQIEQAMEILRKGIEANPFYAPGYSVLANILVQQNSNDEAVDALMAALKNDPQRPGDLLSLGNHFLKSDEMKSRTFLWAAQVFEPQDSKVCALYEQACESFRKRQESGEEKETGIKEPESGGFTRIETQADPVDKSGGADEDIDEIVESFGKDRNLDVPHPITERKEESGEDKPLKNEKEDSPEGGISTASDSKDNTPLEFGVIDDDADDSNKEKILEINEEEEYDLARYGFVSSSEDDSPVLSEEERKELMSLAESDETEHRETEDEPGGGVEKSVLTSPSCEDSGAPFQEGFFGRLSKEEIDVLSSTEKEDPTDDFASGAKKAPGIVDVFEDDLKTFEKMNLKTPGIDVLQGMAQFSGESVPHPITSSTVPKNGKKEDEASLDSVINEYLTVLGKKHADPGKTGTDPIKPIPPLSTRNPTQVLEKGRQSHASVPLSTSGSYTATMAEIYVSQGLISGAIDIYASLLERDPGNKQIQSRLKELKSFGDHQGNIS